MPSLPEVVRRSAGNTVQEDHREETIIDYTEIKDSVLSESSSREKGVTHGAYSFTFANFDDGGDVSLDFQEAKDMFEKEFIIQALRLFKGKINQTALKANIPKKTLLRKIEKYEINPKDFY